MKKGNLIYHLMLGTAGLLLASAAMAEPYVVTPRGERIVGTRIRANSDGTIVLTVGGGVREFAPNEYKEAVADKPVAYDTARKLMAGGEYEQAIPLLKKIVQEHKFLGWDIRASAVLGQAQLESGDAPGAIRTFEELIKAQPALASNETIKWSYWKALAAGGRAAELEPELKKIIASGDRAAAARGQLLRGDLETANNKIEAALLDYLRTVTLFKKEQEVQPEALYKTGIALETLRDPRAKKFFQMVVDEHGDSSYAALAQQKL